MFTENPNLPFEIVSMDIMELNESHGNKKIYLVTFEYFSVFFEKDELKNMSQKVKYAAASMILQWNTLKKSVILEIFNRLGI